MNSSTKTLPQSNIGDKGCLSAAILSVYDLPNVNGKTVQPLHISMTLLGKEVRTGPPSAKHREKNSFKFVAKGKEENILSISAPLDMLYPETVVFSLALENENTLVAHCKLNSLHINESQWLILNLNPPGENQVQEENGTTLRIKMCLSGPFRKEVAAIISMSNMWFDTFDSVSTVVSSSVSSISSFIPQQLPSSKLILLPTIPLATAAVALLPVLLGLLVVGLPFFLPVLVALLGIGASIAVGSGVVYLSSAAGREYASNFLVPIWSTFLMTSAGQSLVYDTGPRPSPVALAATILPKDMMGRLVVSLVIDFVGSSSYLLPVVGEGFDVAWAPIQTILLMAMYDETMPSLKYISFMEEILPFTDALPSGTLGWCRQYSHLLLGEGMKRVDELRVVLKRD